MMVNDNETKSIEFKLPKGTIVKYEGIALRLTESIYIKANKENEEFIIENSKIIHDIMEPNTNDNIK